MVRQATVHGPQFDKRCIKMSQVKPVHHSSTWTERIILKILSQQLHVPLPALIERPAM